MANTTVKNWTKTWERAYETIYNGNVNHYKKRLRELLEWDKPITPKNNDPAGKWREWSGKVHALEGLIKEEYPNTKITLDNKILLRK